MGIAVRQEGADAFSVIRNCREILQSLLNGLIHGHAVFKIAIHVVQDRRGRKSSTDEHEFAMDDLGVAMDQRAILPEFLLAHGAYFAPVRLPGNRNRRSNGLKNDWK